MQLSRSDFDHILKSLHHTITFRPEELCVRAVEYYEKVKAFRERIREHGDTIGAADMTNPMDECRKVMSHYSSGPILPVSACTPF